MRREYTVGQKLWLVPNYSRGPERYVEIIKVGRKWLSLTGGFRVNKETLVGDCARCYLSKEDLEHRAWVHANWLRMRRMIEVHCQPPDGVSVEDMDRVLELLGLQQPKGFANAT